MTHKKTTYEIQWGSAGSRRVETVEGHGYETGKDPNPYLWVFEHPKTENDNPKEVFELIGHNFAIRPVEE